MDLFVSRKNQRYMYIKRFENKCYTIIYTSIESVILVYSSVFLSFSSMTIKIRLLITSVLDLLNYKWKLNIDGHYILKRCRL